LLTINYNYMKKLYYLSAGVLFVALMAFINHPAKHPYGLKNGAPGIQSINAIAFGPDGILFIGDSRSSAVFAIDTKDKVLVEKAKPVEMKAVDQKIAAALGTEAKNIKIQDIAVNPISKKLYIAVQGLDGKSVLLTLSDNKIEAVNLKDVPFSSTTISDPPGDDKKDWAGRPLRESVISDLVFADGSVMVSGLSNQEFSSTFRRISFPFNNKLESSSLEIYHAAHGRYETNAPIRTFTTAELNGKKYLVASYTCTPLVLFPLDELKPGKHVKGRTVGEFGAGNSPVDMISVKDKDNNYLMLANNNRPVMRVKYTNIEKYEGSLTEPVKESFATAGVEFVSLPVVNVLQMDKLDDNSVVILQRRGDGDMELWTAIGERWFH